MRTPSWSSQNTQRMIHYSLDLLRNGLPFNLIWPVRSERVKMCNNFFVLFYRGPKVISTTGSEPTMSAKTVSHWTRACQSSRAAWRTTSRNERVISCPGSSSKAILQLAYIIERLASRTKIGKKSGFPSVENSSPMSRRILYTKIGRFFFLLHCRLFQDWYSK